MEHPDKLVSATEIKNRLGDYLGEVTRRRKPLLIEKHGKPVAVLVDVEQWRRLEEKGEKAWEDPWIAACRALNKKILRRNPKAKHTPAVDLIRALREEAE